jgi:hypothetical protein
VWFIRVDHPKLRRGGSEGQQRDTLVATQESALDPAALDVLLEPREHLVVVKRTTVMGLICSGCRRGIGGPQIRVFH